MLGAWPPLLACLKGLNCYCLLGYADLVMPCYLQAIGDQEAQRVVKVCSDQFSPWLLAHIPDILRSQPAARSVLDRNLPNIGCTQVKVKSAHHVLNVMCR